ncbi:MAG TPA: LysR family transcriptional regulator [Candidatus Thioglobus sp.]|jgi:LysR family transcriptional regulator for metE and metH|nr:LysR family transcriptional regulator [Candidatus Thioglobus sp.]HIL21204.1 LysR family transcriptional regulator [Candidatus Thioglobus sp.]
MIERSHLSILREIERSGTLTAAAESLHLTQSALTHAIKKLEQRATVKLWNKEGRAIRLTQAGSYLLSVANRLLPQLEYADQVIERFARGEKGAIRIGMECHPCYQWLLKVVTPYIERYPEVDIDVKQQFQFGGMKALLNYDIDVLVTPDPAHQPGVTFKPVLDYQQVLAVSTKHTLAKKTQIDPKDLVEEVLYSYPVDIDRLDIYSHFLTPAHCRPKEHKSIEATDIMLQLVAAGRGVAALPHWLVNEYADKMAIKAVRLGRTGVSKSIYLGLRDDDQGVDYIQAFIKQAEHLD